MNFSPQKRAGDATSMTKSASSSSVTKSVATTQPGLLGGKRTSQHGRLSDNLSRSGKGRTSAKCTNVPGSDPPLPPGVQSSNGVIHFQSRQEFEDACWSRVKPYHQIIEVLEAKLESAQQDAEDTESYKNAVEISRGQNQQLEVKFSLAVDNFEKRIAEVKEILELRNREISELRGHVNDLRLSRDSAFDELALGKNKEAIAVSEERDAGILATQNRVLSEALQESREYVEADQQRRTEEKRRYRENEHKWTKQIEGLSDQLMEAVTEKSLLNQTMQDNVAELQKERERHTGWQQEKINLENSVKQYERELRELRSKNQMYSETKQMLERQDGQLANRGKQLEEMRATFESQLGREVDIQQRLMKEKQDLQTEVRELQKKVGHESDNWKSEERDRKLCQAKILELEHKLVLAGDSEKQSKHSIEVANTSETKLQEWVAQFEEHQTKFEQHLATERERVTLLEKDNADLKQLLQEIQPEFHKLQTELEKAQFRLNEAELKEANQEDERNLRKTLADEMSDMEAELESLKKAKEDLQNSVVDNNAKMWDEYILKEEAETRTQPLHSLLQGEFRSTNSQTPGDKKHMYKYSAVKNDVVDKVLADCINLHKPPVPFYRLSQGIYLYGSKKILVKLSKQNKLIFRVGGGYCSFEEFISQFSQEELAKLN